MEVIDLTGDSDPADEEVLIDLRLDDGLAEDMPTGEKAHT